MELQTSVQMQLTANLKPSPSRGSGHIQTE